MFAKAIFSRGPFNRSWFLHPVCIFNRLSCQNLSTHCYSLSSSSVLLSLLWQPCPVCRGNIEPFSFIFCLSFPLQPLPWALLPSIRPFPESSGAFLNNSSAVLNWILPIPGCEVWHTFLDILLVYNSSPRRSKSRFICPKGTHAFHDPRPDSRHFYHLTTWSPAALVVSLSGLIFLRQRICVSGRYNANHDSSANTILTTH